MASNYRLPEKYVEVLRRRRWAFIVLSVLGGWMALQNVAEGPYNDIRYFAGFFLFIVGLIAFRRFGPNRELYLAYDSVTPPASTVVLCMVFFVFGALVTRNWDAQSSDVLVAVSPFVLVAGFLYMIIASYYLSSRNRTAAPKAASVTTKHKKGKRNNADSKG